MNELVVPEVCHVDADMKKTANGAFICGLAAVWLPCPAAA